MAILFYVIKCHPAPGPSLFPKDESLWGILYQAHKSIYSYILLTNIPDYCCGSQVSALPIRYMDMYSSDFQLLIFLRPSLLSHEEKTYLALKVVGRMK